MSPAVGPPFARGPPPRAFAPPDDDDATATETETDADLAARSEWGGRDRADPMARSIAPLRRATSADGRRGAPVPVARHPALLPFVLTPPNADDDPKLLPSAAPAFVAAFLSVIPPGSAVELRTTFLEAHAHYSGAPWPHADPRWRRFYLHPLFVCVVHWVGARVLRDRGDPGDRQYSSEFTVAEVVDRHEKRFERLLREELDRFWDEAEQAQEEGDLKALHTEENLALQWALGIGMTFVSMQMQRPAAARAFIRHCIAIWRAMRVPGEDGFEPEISGLDDFLVYHSWVAIFWIVTMFEFFLAARTQTPTLFDPGQEFPTVPFPHPGLTLTRLPPPSLRTQNCEIPMDLLPPDPKFRAIEYIGWLDPITGVAADPHVRDIVLLNCVTKLRESGVMHFIGLLRYAALKIQEFSTWLKDDAGLRLIDVLVAEELIRRGQAGEGDVEGVAPGYVGSVLGNPLLKEAVRRRAFLRDSLDLIESKLPPEVAAGARASDAERVCAAVSFLAPPAQQQLLGHLTMMRQLVMLLSSPGAFEDVEDEAANEDDETGSALGASLPPDRDRDVLLQLWFASPSFREASRNAMIISANVRMQMARYTRDEIAANVYAVAASEAAAAAAWFHLLVLKRFRALLGAASSSEQAGAAHLHAALLADVRSCMDMLEHSGRPEHLAARALLQGFLESDRVRLTGADLQMMAVAEKLARRCPHQTGGDAGACWICATERGMEGGEGEEKEDPLASIPVPANLRHLGAGASFGSGVISATGTAVEGGSAVGVQGRKKVRWAASLAVIGETYSKEEYPARSMFAREEAADEDGSDEEEDAGVQRPSGTEALAMLLEQREEQKPALGFSVVLGAPPKTGDKPLPDLKSFWRGK